MCDHNLGSLKVIGAIHKSVYDLLFTFHRKCLGLSCIVIEIPGVYICRVICRKSKIFPTPHILGALLENPLELHEDFGIRILQYAARLAVTVVCVMFSRFGRAPASEWRTDIQTDKGPKHIALAHRRAVKIYRKGVSYQISRTVQLLRLRLRLVPLGLSGGSGLLILNYFHFQPRWGLV